VVEIIFDPKLKPYEERINKMKSAAVIGAGLMGSSISELFIEKTKLHLYLVDISEEILSIKKAQIEKDLKRMEKRGLIDSWEEASKRISYTTKYEDIEDVDLVVEAVTEREDIKRDVYQRLNQTVSDECIIATNTSSHTVKKLGKFLSPEKRKKFCAMHFYTPVASNAFVDVVKSDETDEDVFQTLNVLVGEVFERVKINPRDSPGYINDKIFVAMTAIAMQDIQEGKVGIEEYDKLWEAFGLRYGPFAVSDMTGPDPFTMSVEVFGSDLEDKDPTKPLYREGLPDFVRYAAEQWKKSRGSGERKGFYKWKKGEDGQLKIVGVLNPKTKEYEPLKGLDKRKHRSIFKAKEDDKKRLEIKSIEGMRDILIAEDRGGELSNEYVLPFFGYILYMVQEGIANFGEVEKATRVGLGFKHGLIEMIDKISHTELIHLLEGAVEKDPKRKYLYELGIDSPIVQGPDKFLEYGKLFETPVGYYDIESRSYFTDYSEIKLNLNFDDRVAVITFNTPLKANIWTLRNFDQINNAWESIERYYSQGLIGAVLSTAAGNKMPLNGADLRGFISEWYTGGRAETRAAIARKISEKGLPFLDKIEKSPIPSIDVSGRSYGGGTEYRLAQKLRYVLRLRDKNGNELPVFIQPETEIGITCGLGGYARWRRLTNVSMANRVYYEGFKGGLTATEAENVGLARAFDTKEEAQREGYKMAKHVAFMSPGAMKTLNEKIKHYLEGRDVDIPQELKWLSIFDTPDAQIGVARMISRGRYKESFDYIPPD